MTNPKITSIEVHEFQYETVDMAAGHAGRQGDPHGQGAADTHRRRRRR